MERIGLFLVLVRLEIRLSFTETIGTSAMDHMGADFRISIPLVARRDGTREAFPQEASIRYIFPHPSLQSTRRLPDTTSSFLLST
jgi:hypothetical protein